MVERTFSLDGGGELGTEGAIGGIDDALGAVSLGGGDTRGTSGGGGGDDTVFDPERHIGVDKRNADGSYRRKRQRRGSSEGRATASPRSKSKADYSASLDSLTNMLVIVHAGVASMTKIKEFEIERTEARVLAEATANVLVEFDITPDPKVQAIVGLVMAAGSVYGPRLYLHRERMKEERRKSKSAHIVGMNGEIIS